MGEKLSGRKTDSEPCIAYGSRGESFISAGFCPNSSLGVWTKWHLLPYGQKPSVWKVRQSSVLYLGCLQRERSSAMPCANWHFSPYLHVPYSSNARHSSVLYREELDCLNLRVILVSFTEKTKL